MQFLTPNWQKNALSPHCFALAHHSQTDPPLLRALDRMGKTTQQLEA